MSEENRQIESTISYYEKKNAEMPKKSKEEKHKEIEQKASEIYTDRMKGIIPYFHLLEAEGIKIGTQEAEEFMKNWDLEKAKILCNPVSEDKEGFVADLNYYISEKKGQLLTLETVVKNGEMFGFSKKEALKIFGEWRKSRSIKSRFRVDFEE